MLTEAELRRRRLWCVGCAVLGCSVAALVLWSWAAGVSDLLSFDPRHIPMAPSTALVFLALTAGLLAWSQRPHFRRVLACVHGVAGLATLAGLLALLRPWLGWGSPLERWLAQGAMQSGAVPVGQMSPLTGVLLMGLAAALVLRVPPLNRWRGARWGAVLVTGALLALSAGVAISYAVSSPWLFGGAFIPPSFPTTLTFLLLGLTLLAMPPPAAAPAPSSEPRPALVRLPWLLTLLMIALFGALSAVYLRCEQTLRRSEALELMTSVGQLKAAEISHWRTEHWNTVHYFATDPMLANAAQAFLQQPEAADARALVMRRFNMIAADGEFPLIALFDTNAVARLTLPERPDQPPVLAAELIADMLLKRRGLMTDLHLDPARRYSHIDLVFPFFATAATDAPATGFCLVRLDPRPFLFPLLNAWPTASRSAEMVLVRREGTDVVFLNEPRQATHNSSQLRLPLDPHSQVPAVMAALGRTGTIEGLDYRGAPVLADIRAIPDSHWLLITKMDRAELYAPLRRQAWLTLLLTLALAGLVGVAIWLARKQREVRIVRGDLALEREIARLTRLYATLSQINQCLVRVTSRETLFREVCRITAEFSGFKLAWIGWLDDATQQVVPVGRAGDDQGYLDKIRVYADDRPEGQGPVGICLRENRPVIFNDFVEDPRAQPWQRAALVHGLRAVAALPLRLGGHTCGTFAVYANEPGVFQDKERALLEEAATDISFALENLAQAERHHQTDAALHESEERYRLLADNTDDFVHLNMADGRRLYTSPSFFRATGWTPAELDQGDWRARIHPDDLERVVAAHAANLRGEKTVNEYRIARKDGTWLWVHASCQPLRDAAGRVEKMVLWAHDITDRKQATAAMQQSEEQFRGMFEMASIGMAQADPHTGRFLRVNQKMCAITGYPAEELLARRVQDITHPDDRASDGEQFRRVVQGALPEYQIEKRYIRKDGTPAWVNINMTVLRNAHGRPLRTMATIEDITERKRLEEEREITVRLLSLLNAPNNLHELMRQVTLLLHDWFDCEAVGIRLRAGEDYPYFETRGFPAEFVRLENHLCHCDAEGRVIRDALGQPVYECMCGNVLCGRFDASKPFFTARGSFWANDTTRLLATTTDTDRQTPTRNRCNGEGYESVALVALRTGETTYGLLQLNDKRKHRFTPERIALLERLADSLAISIAHRQNQTQLQESEEKYRRLVDNANEMIYVAQGGIIKFANRMCAQLTGFSEAELLGKPTADFAVPEEREHVAQHQARLARGETPGSREEFRLRFRDGSEHWLSISSVQIQWQDQPATLNFAADITERKLAEMALTLARNDWADTFDSITDMVTVHDKDFNIIRANKAAQQILGGSPMSKVLDAKCFRCYHGTNQPPGGCPSCESIRNGQATFFEVFEPHLQRYLEIRAIPRFDAKQQVVGLIHIVRDITERKQAEATLQLQGAALAAAANAIVITDAQGTIEWANPAFTTFTGYLVTEAQGRNPRELIKSGEHDAAFYKELWDTILAGRVWRGELVNRRKDGTLYTEDMTVTPLRDAAGTITHFIAIKQDITERKHLEAHLLRNQRLESVGRLASGVAHDLNNILAPVLLAPPLLREAIRDPETLSLIDTIESSAQRGAEIIKQLLTFGRGLKGERIPVQLRTLVREMLKLMRETFPKDITVATQLPAELPLVTGDATQLHQILMNLCVNARDAMPAGGELVISLAPVTLDAAAAAALPGARPGRFLVLGVGDTGTGIAPEDLDKIFDPFFTTKPIGEGTGLGLSTVLGIVRSHAGFVQVQSKPGQGTRFSVYLPLSESAEAPELAAVAKPTLPQGHGEQVLIVDDEIHLRSMARRFLESNGYRVLEAQDGAEALQVLGSLRELPQVLVTDLIMPRMDGLALLRALLQRKTGLKLLAMGGLPPPPEVLAELGLSAQQFIAKPFCSATLLNALHSILAGA